MTFEEFKQAVLQDEPPAGVSESLRALWVDANGDWDAAHTIVQDVHTTDGSWVHAYLHRKEGDLSNASYWYHRAGKTVFDGSLDAEWEKIARALL